jgi:hypothetical protein
MWPFTKKKHEEEFQREVDDFEIDRLRFATICIKASDALSGLISDETFSWINQSAANDILRAFGHLAYLSRRGKRARKLILTDGKEEKDG